MASRDLRWLVLHHAAGSTGQSLGTVAIAKALYDQTGSTAWVAAAAAGRLVPYLVVSAAAGVVADRVDRVRLLRWSAGLRLLATALLAALVAVGAPPLAVVGLVTLATTLGTPCYPALTAMVPLTVPAENLAPANGILSTVETASWVVGPAVGGALLIGGEPAAALLVNAAVFLVGLVLLAPLRQRRLDAAPEPPAEDRRFFTDLTAGFRAILSGADVAAPLLLVVVVNLVLGGSTVGLVMVAEELVDLGQGGFGILNAALGAGGFLGVLGTNWVARQASPMRAIGIATLAGGAPFALLAEVHVPAIAVALMVAAGAGAVVTEVAAMTLMLRALPQGVLARVFGIVDSLLVGSILVGSLLAPILIELVGLRASLIVVGGLIPASALVGAHGLQRAGRRGTAARRRIEPRLVPLAAQPWLADVLPLALEALAAQSAEEHVAGGVDVVRQGDTPDDFFVVLEGSFVVTKRTGDADPVVINRLGPRTGFGEIGLLGQIPRTATVTAEGPGRVLRVRGDHFVLAVNRTPLAGDSAIGAGFVARIANTADGDGGERPDPISGG
jgi:MFS family permease